MKMQTPSGGIVDIAEIEVERFLALGFKRVDEQPKEKKKVKK